MFVTPKYSIRIQNRVGGLGSFEQRRPAAVLVTWHGLLLTWRGIPRKARRAEFGPLENT